MMDDDLTRAVTKLRRLEDQVEELRSSIREQILAKRSAGISQADLVRLTGWTRETIRKIERRGPQDQKAKPRASSKSTASAKDVQHPDSG